jgi:DNA-binding GntR family transcriptional regulator
METSSTLLIVESLTRAIVEHRLHPGTKLAEQKLADHFGVSRTLVRQALFQLSQNRLIRLEPARGAFVATPSVQEAQQVFAVRRMLEVEMTRAFVRSVTPAKLKALREHVAQEKLAVSSADVPGRTELLGDFHVRMAELMGNQVLAELLRELISRCALITLMYQSNQAAEHSNDEHADIVKALAARDEELAVRLMNEHLLHVEENLTFDRRHLDGPFMTLPRCLLTACSRIPLRGPCLRPGGAGSAAFLAELPSLSIRFSCTCPSTTPPPPTPAIWPATAETFPMPDGRVAPASPCSSC